MAISRFTANEAARAGLRPDRIVVTPCGASGAATPERALPTLKALGFLGLVLVVASIVAGRALLGPSPDGAGTLRHPIDPYQQNAVGFG